VVTALLGLWVITALLYPWLRRGVVSFVDSIILRRADYGKLRADVAHLLTEQETSHDILEEVCQVLGPALSAHGISWAEIGESEFTKTSRIPGATEDAENDGNPETTPRLALTMRLIKSEVRLHEPENNDYVTLLEGSGSKSALVLIPTAEPPYFRFNIGTLAGGRRLLSDDIAMLESVAVMVARRIDALRVNHERCEQNLREQEINKLATEAQLRALRAQVNPHFLFNALTTIGYLVQTSPDRALETLMKLTSLLRGVLRSDGEFVTLGEELELIASYLDIERARFEERLRTTVDVPENLRSLRLPSLLVQPLVENAIKHGITPSRFGGEVNISARLEDSFAVASNSGEVLSITVSDTGVGASEIELARGRRRGLGLNNIEERLRCYGGQSASLRIASIPTQGTVVELRIPVAISQRLSNETSSARLQSIKEKKGA